MGSNPVREAIEACGADLEAGYCYVGAMKDAITELDEPRGFWYSWAVNRLNVPQMRALDEVVERLYGPVS